MNGFKGTLEEFHTERERLRDKYGVTYIVTGCYLCNFGREYMCGKCRRVEMCRGIEKGEKQDASEE